jgi:hypothetical protein
MGHPHPLLWENFEIWATQPVDVAAGASMPDAPSTGDDARHQTCVAGENPHPCEDKQIWATLPERFGKVKRTKADKNLSRSERKNLYKERREDEKLARKRDQGISR